jgi:prepilin signal peptidase PulO-like enzyme (type II secretory pathway)
MLPFTFIAIVVFVIGLCVGSFLNVIILRLSLPDFSFWKDIGGLKNRSYCPHCRTQLNWPDLIPVASFMWLRGECRYCQKKISIQYPLVELATAFILLGEFLVIGQQIPDVFALFTAWFVSACLVIIFVYDLKHYLIPDEVLFPAIVIEFLYRLWHLPSLSNYVLAALIAAAFFLVIFLISKGEWMGFGDVKLAVLLGLMLGFSGVLLCLFLSFVFGAIIGSILIGLKRKSIKSQLPFAPFLILAAFVVLFFGDQIIHWYLSLFIL